MPNDLDIKNCFAKAVYHSRAAAKKVIRRVFGKRGLKLRTYKCPNCEKWHLTKGRKKKSGELGVIV